MKKTEKETLKKEFSRLLLTWDRRSNSRQMPWKGEKDPYRIWLSEIILQQTRVEQGWEYYNRFIKTFPDIRRLAAAPDKKVFKLWEGLGYYSRCRNLLATARYITNERKGIFPDTYEAIKSLKGVGPYTAAAIASFAFGLPHAVVDGNVFRVLSRVFGIAKPIDSGDGKKYFTALAEELLDKKQPGRYNQALMDFGAVVCKPQSPQCPGCPFRKSCCAYIQNKTDQLPVKSKKTGVRHRRFYYLVLESGNEKFIRQRREKDIWQDLFEFPFIESAKSIPVNQVLTAAVEQHLIPKENTDIISVSPEYRQQLSHQKITATFIRIRSGKKRFRPDGCIRMNKKNTGHYPFPRLIRRYLDGF